MSGDDASAQLRGAALFMLIWDTIADVLGTPVAATLLHRAAQRAMARRPELAELEFQRTDNGYTYTLPLALVGKLEHTPVALRELVSELRPLLVEFGWQAVVHRIEQIPQLQERGILSLR